jgi:hypothetical protein
MNGGSYLLVAVCILVEDKSFHTIYLLPLLDHDADAPPRKRVSSSGDSVFCDRSLNVQCVSRILWPPSPRTLLLVRSSLALAVGQATD